MKFFFSALFFFIPFFGFSQYSIEINSGNHSDIISADYDRGSNQLIALDKLGFIVIWDLGNFSIINKFQLPPENIFMGTRREMLGRYEVKAYDSIIAVTYPTNYYQTNNGERLVDLYNRRTGRFIMQTPLARISSVVFTKDRWMYVATATTTKSTYLEPFVEGSITRTDANNKSVSVTVDEVPVCMEADERKKRLALGYRTGKVEIRDLATLELLQSFNSLEKEQEKKIAQMVFIPASDKIAFVAEHSGNVMIHDVKTGKMVDSLQLPESEYRLAASPSGKYLSVIWSGFYYIYRHDLQKKVTEKKLINDPVGIGIYLNDIFFTTDDMMIGVGRNSIASSSIKMNGLGNVGAWLGWIDTKSNITSTNLNITTASAWMDRYGTKMLKGASLTSVLHGSNNEFAYTDPSKLALRSGSFTQLKDQFSQYLDDHNYPGWYMSSMQRTGSNSAYDLSDATIGASIYTARRGVFTAETDTFFVGHYNIPADSFISATQLILPAKDAHYYDLQGTLHKQGLIFFMHTYKNKQERKATELIVFNKEGKRVLMDSLVDGYNARKISVSPDQKYFTYQPAPGKLLVLSANDLSLVHSINTGFGLYGYDPSGYTNARFLKGKPSVLVYEVSKMVNNNQWFCVLSTDITTQRTDTVISFALRPVNYEVDSTGTQLALLYNYDFTDSAFSNNEIIQQAVLQGFKPLYQPSVLVYDVPAKDIVSSIHTGKTGISDVAIDNKWITVLQNDGQLLYFNRQTKNKVSQVLDGNAQALVADSFYFASQGLLPLIRFKTAERSFSAMQADIFLNRPHDILKQFLPSNNDVIKPYQMAYAKRLDQEQVLQKKLTEILKADADIKMTGVPQTFIFTEERSVSLPFNINTDRSNITNIRVLINGQQVSGKKGVNIKKALSDKKISIDLSQGENLVTILAETAGGKQLDPVKYYYYFDSKNYRSPKLYFFSAGVSDYKDTVYNLKYAAKDATDILQAFRNKIADTIVSEVLTNKNVTKQNINAWAKQIEQAEVDDIVILYFAGHGLLDARNNFYYAVHDIDFKQPEKNGLSYEAILNLLDKSPSRKKILLLDACHSGAFDRSTAKESISSSTTAGVVVNNEKRGLTIKGTNQPFSERQAFILMNQVFADFSSDIGIDVIAASLGNSYALEKNDLQNGLFTYAMIRAVALSFAAGKGKETETITMEQVKQYIDKEVRRLSHGEQVPSIRSSNVLSGQIQFHYSWNNYSEEWKQFLDKYR